MTDKHPLGSLILAVQQAHGWSDRELELRAGGQSGMGKSNLSKLKNRPLKSIRGSTIKNLSRLLDVPEELVARATLGSLEDPVGLGGDISLVEAVAANSVLSVEDKAFLGQLIERMTSSPSDGRGAGVAMKEDEDGGAALKTKKRAVQKGMTDTEVARSLQERDLDAYGEGFR